MQCQSAASTMVDLLSRQAMASPDRTAYVFLDDRGGSTQITFAELDCRARVIAARLQLELRPGDPALLVYPPGLDFISAFFGCQYAGVIAVPATYPKPRRPLPRLKRIALDCDAHVALSTAATLETLDPQLLSKDAATSQWIATDELVDALAEQWEPPAVHGSDLAFLQYTSGSTSDPKGVMVSHANLLNNLECIRRSFGIGEVDEDESATGVFWLPAYHDMGLIGGVLTPLYMGGRSVLMSPTAFLQRPIRWLQAIHEHRATISGAPNFAYDFCARRSKPEERAGLDLSRWRLAFCGAEPIRAETIEAFAETFREFGFRSSAIYPCYGLAETTLLAAGPDYTEQPTILTVNRQALADHRVVVALANEPVEMTQRLVGCGRAMPDHKLLIVDPASTEPRAPGAVGEICIQGPSVAQGYWNRAEESADMFGATIAGHVGHFVRTGDLGFIRDGQLFVTGRLKDMIIIRGRNHYPQDIEQSAEEAHPAVLMGAAFALEGEQGERLVAVHQVDRQYRGADMDQVVQAIRRSIVEHHELDPSAIVLIRQTSLPITSSGKVQRALCRQQYERGELKVVHAWTNPAINGARSREQGAGSKNKIRLPARRSRLPAGSIEVDRTAERIEGWMLQWLVVRLSINPAEVSRDRPFAEYGVDSLTAVEMSQELEDQFQVPLPPIVAWNFPTPATLSRYLAEQTLGVASSEPGPSGSADQAAPSDDRQLAELLDEIENLSDDEAARLLAEEESSSAALE